MSKTFVENAFLVNITAHEREAIKDSADYSGVESLPEIWPLAAQKFGSIVALRDPHAKPEVVLTYIELCQQIQRFAAGLQALGVQAGDRISLIADNSPRWLIADQGIMTAGGVDAVRSSQADKEELLFIVANSGSTALVVEDLKTLNKLRGSLNDLPIQFVIVLSNEALPEAETLKLYTFSQLMEIGDRHSLQPVKRNRNDLATLIYTSGTTGKPKGVMLTHRNLMHQIVAIPVVVQPRPGDTVLSILPTWHSYERSCEYFLLSQGCTQVYTNLRSIKRDLKEYQPHYMVAVPRLLESIYEGAQKQFREQPASRQRLINFFFEIGEKYIKARRTLTGLNLENLNPSMGDRLTASLQVAALSPLYALGEKLVYSKVREATGGRVKQMISGGGALPKHVDDFFEILGVEILVGYGLTETSPVTHARRHWRNLRGAAGQPIPGTETKIVDPETKK
ncbi:long-chain fatty acid--CoA ligase, partial [Fischerella thermalis CCMEE 5319]